MSNLSDFLQTELSETNCESLLARQILVAVQDSCFQRVFFQKKVNLKREELKHLISDSNLATVHRTSLRLIKINYE